MGAGNYTIQLENEETVDYESTQVSIQLEVFDETSCINCSLLNGGEVYANVSYDESNHTKAFYSIQCEFDANINYTSSLGQGQCTAIGNRHFATISAPNASGSYQIQFSAHPIAAGKVIEFTDTLQVKRRPVELSPTMVLDDRQSHLFFCVQVTDELTNQSIDANNDIAIFARYNGSTQLIGIVECNLSGVASFEWQLPNFILEDYISFTFQFIESPVYQFSSLNKNVTIMKFEYLGPFQAHAAQTITITARLRALNGTYLPNQPIKLTINGAPFNLTTDSNGAISHSFITPSHATTLRIELHFPGSASNLATTLVLAIEISLDPLHRLWNSLGFILAGTSIGIVSLICLKRRFAKRNLATLKVD